MEVAAHSKASVTSSVESSMLLPICSTASSETDTRITVAAVSSLVLTAATSIVFYRAIHPERG